MQPDRLSDLPKRETRVPRCRERSSPSLMCRCLIALELRLSVLNCLQCLLVGFGHRAEPRSSPDLDTSASAPCSSVTR